MTTGNSRSASASSGGYAPNSQAVDNIAVFGSDGRTRIIPRKNYSTAQANSAPCLVLRLEALYSPKKSSENVSDFDALVQELEDDPDTAKQLGEGRKWVAQAFYGDAPTLASLRLGAGLSQKELAEICDIAQPHVSRYESGRHEPSLSLAAKMASALGVTMDRFVEAWKNTCKQPQLERPL